MVSSNHGALFEPFLFFFFGSRRDQKSRDERPRPLRVASSCQIKASENSPAQARGKDVARGHGFKWMLVYIKLEERIR